MGKDLTLLFKTNVSNQKVYFNEEKNKNSKKIKDLDSFSQESNEIVNCLNQLQSLIYDNRVKNQDIRFLKQYFDCNKEKNMEDLVNIVLNSSFQKLALLKNAYLESLSPQHNMHRKLVCDSILTLIKRVSQSFVQERTMKAQKIMQHIDISRLQRKQIKVSRVFEKEKNVFPYASSSTTHSNALNNGLDGSTDKKTNYSKYGTNLDADLNQNTEDRANEKSSNFTQEEIQEFEQENRKIYEEYTSSLNEIQSIEKKMVEISRLQDVLTDNLLTQDESIDRVADSTVNTTENVKQGNVEILQALQHKAGVRVWMLFILIVLTFSLLFLDWYNP